MEGEEEAKDEEGNSNSIAGDPINTFFLSVCSVPSSKRPILSSLSLSDSSSTAVATSPDPFDDFMSLCDSMSLAGTSSNGRLGESADIAAGGNDQISVY